ncbi:MAG: hypothetical protein EBW53_06975 [Actinobacteria bacterium]|nr:hypothetical protein [Actinomycetota bacterium]
MRPNVLLVTLDQFRGDCLSSLGHSVVRTPHLDALAKESVTVYVSTARRSMIDSTTSRALLAASAIHPHSLATPTRELIRVLRQTPTTRDSRPIREYYLASTGCST